MLVTDNDVKPLDQQLENSLQRLNQLWKGAGHLSVSQKQQLIEQVEELCDSLQTQQIPQPPLEHLPEAPPTYLTVHGELQPPGWLKFVLDYQSLTDSQMGFVAKHLLSCYLDREHPLETSLLELQEANQQLKQELTECQQIATSLRQQLAEAQQLNQDLDQEARSHTAELQQALDFEVMLRRITDQVRSHLEQKQILQTAVQELTQLLEVQGSYGVIYASQEKTPTISYEYSAGIIAESTDPQSIITFPEVYAQLQQTPGFQFCICGQDTTAASTILVCPIVDKQEILGILCLFKPPQATFQDLQLRLVYQVAHQCAIALRQAQSYAAVQTQVAELGRLNQLKDDFLSTVSHELRTPVSNMKMAMQMLGIALNRESTLFYELTKPPTEQSKVARYFQILHNECEREISLINDLLDLQRLDSGDEALVLTTIRIQDWLPPLVAPFQAQAQKRQQSLEVQVAAQLPALICDHASVGRVISELLNNACKYTPPEERIIVAARATTEKIELSVTNFGVEIPPCEQKRIFDKFYRIPSADPWKQGGTGLGLALVQKLVSHLGGTIEVESGSSQTCFTVSLPIFPNG